MIETSCLVSWSLEFSYHQYYVLRDVLFLSLKLPGGVINDAVGKIGNICVILLKRRDGVMYDTIFNAYPKMNFLDQNYLLTLQVRGGVI